MSTDVKPNLREEAFAESALNVDRDAGVVRDVKILGTTSKNGRIYTENARNDAARLYEGAPVNFNHRSPDDRNVRDVEVGWGIIRETRVKPDGVYGDIHYLKNHPHTEMILERAERFPNSFGLSHDAVGNVTEGFDGKPDTVDSLELVESVDLVSKPATNRGLFESHNPKRKPMKLSVSKVLGRRRTTEAKRLAKLLEMDDYEAMADAPVEAPAEAAEASPGDDVKASIEAMVLAIVRGDGDAKDKLAKIRQVLGVEDKIANAGGEGDDPPKDDPPSDEVKEAQQRVKRLEKRDRHRDLLESSGMSFSDLSKVQQRMVDNCEDDDEVEELIESFQESKTGKQGDNKPKVRSAIQESMNTDPGRSSLENLLKDAKSAR